MANFSLFETFFFLTLAITFILILLLVYHFKDRLSKLEQKSDSMFNIIYDISDEMSKTNNRNEVILGPSLDHYHNPLMYENETPEIQEIGGSLALTEPEFDVKKIENINLNLQSDTEDDLSESSESDNEGIESDEDNEEDEDNDDIEEDKTTIEKIDVPSMGLDYKKMNVGDLRELVQSKGLVEDAKKLKKNELIALLQ